MPLIFRSLNNKDIDGDEHYEHYYYYYYYLIRFSLAALSKRFLVCRTENTQYLAGCGVKRAAKPLCNLQIEKPQKLQQMFIGKYEMRERCTSRERA